MRLDALGDRTLPAFASEMVSAETKADGTFALGPLPLGSLRIAVSARGHATRQVQVEIPARRHAADVGDVVLEVGLAIRGRVRERAGKGVAGVALQALREGPGGPSQADAASDVLEYWVVDVSERTIEVFAAPDGERYTKATVFRGSDVLAVPGFPDVNFAVDALFRPGP